MTARPPGHSYLSAPEGLALVAVFQERAKALLAQRGMTYAQLSEASGVPFRTVDNMLRPNGTSPSLIGAAAVAQVLGTTVDHLCGLDTAVVENDRLVCLHTPHWMAGTTACPQCTSAWRNIQRIKSDLYAANRQETAPLKLDASLPAITD